MKVHNLDGRDISTFSLDWRSGVLNEPDSFKRKGSHLYVAVKLGGQLARINTQTNEVDYLYIAPPASSGWALHGMAVRP